MTASPALSIRPPASARPRIMVVDDSAVVRGLLSRWLDESGAFEVVGTASNGRAAVDALDRTEPDIVLLDIDMPELDGMTTLPLLLAKRPGLSVVVISTLTQRNADISLKCLSLGAIDCLPKPETSRGVTTSATFRNDLVAKLMELGRSRHRRGGGVAAAPQPALKIAARPRAVAVVPRCLLIGASTGGPKVVGAVLAGIGPALRRLPTLVVQHMPPVFTAVFAEHLAAQTGLPTREAEQGEKLLPGRVYVAPGGRHLGLSREGGAVSARLDDGPLVNFCRPAVDVLFRDAAALFGSSALALVLTGMGSDGTGGARALVEAGAPVLVQDEATSTVWGMPGSIAKAGLAQEILPLGAIAPAIRGLLGSVG